MNRNMASGALTAGLKTQAAVWNARLSVEAGVTLQAELTAFTPHQHEMIGAAVRIVADDAAFHPYGRMLINVRAALFNVALNAGLPVGGIQAGPVHAAVGIMTIRTLDESFRHAMVHGQGKLCLNVAMTAKAEPGLRCL